MILNQVSAIRHAKCVWVLQKLLYCNGTDGAVAVLCVFDMMINIKTYETEQN